MDLTLLAEIGVVGLIIVLQIVFFIRNLNQSRQLGELFPEGSELDVEENYEVAGSQTANSVPQVKDNGSFSPAFREIIHMTNSYLSRNRGSSQGERLMEIAERKSSSMEEGVETNLPLPLYIGLLATFTGVIIGLIKIGFEGVSDAAIQSFIGGVVVGMVGSATGLLLTVRSNAAFKKHKEYRDEGMEDYFQFLRTKVFHPEAAPVQGSIRDLRESLAAFQDGFAQYQSQMNDSLANTLDLFKELRGVFSQVKGLQQDLNGISSAVRFNDDMIEKQARYMENYSQKAEEFSLKLGSSIQQADRQLEVMVDQNIQALDQSTKSAYVKMDKYLSSLEGGDPQGFARALSDDLLKIKENIKNIQEKSVEINVQLLERISQEQAARQQMATTMENINRQLSTNGGRALRNPAVQVFMYSGILAFTLGIVGGAMYLFQTFAG
ncbi:MAG: hypothetical protein AAFY71_11230 [Bacteroidota bacterium]